MNFQGTHTALVTPFRDGQFDREAFTRLVESQIEQGIDGLVAVGTTGESPTLDHGEHLEVVAETVRLAKGRCSVLAGTGSNATTEAVSLSIEAWKAGADALLVVAPYYNKPSQQGLYLHYKAIAEATPLPVMLYSIPGRCGIEIAVETVVRLAKDCPTITAIKEAGGSVERVSKLRGALPDEFQILCGDDSLTIPFLSVGACGVVSVASNLIPGEVSKMVRAFLAGDTTTAQSIHRKYHSLFNDLFIEPNPVPTKTALARWGWMTADVRLPLCEMADVNRARLFETLDRCGLTKGAQP